jgi:hypothetical protein
MGEKPVKSIRYGGVSVAVFENTVNGNGNTFKTTKITAQKTYFDKENKPQSTTTFDANDLPRVIAGLVEAYLYFLKAGANKEKETDSSTASELE